MPGTCDKKQFGGKFKKGPKFKKNKSNKKANKIQKKKMTKKRKALDLLEGVRKSVRKSVRRGRRSKRVTRGRKSVKRGRKSVKRKRTRRMRGGSYPPGFSEGDENKLWHELGETPKNTIGSAFGGEHGWNNQSPEDRKEMLKSFETGRQEEEELTLHGTDAQRGVF